MRVDSRKQPEFCVVFRQNPLKAMHAFSASIARLSETCCGCGRGSKLSHSHFCHCMMWIFPPKKLSGVFNYCWLPIHKRGSSQKYTSSCPLLQYIHCEEIIAQNSCFLFPPAWLLLESCTMQLPLITSLQWFWAQFCPSPPWRPGNSAIFHVQINLCSATGQQFPLANLPRVLWEVHEHWVGSAGTQWLVTGFSFRSWRGHIAPLMAWRENLERGDPREIPSFVLYHWIDSEILLILPKDSAIVVSLYRGKTTALSKLWRPQKGKIPMWAALRERQLKEPVMRCCFYLG